jgi:hypothetical protein
MVEFSIVMSYHNRKPQLIRTLKSIAFSEKIKDTEIIIVNDGSDEYHNIDDIPTNFDFPIRVINIDKENKRHINPCIPYNIGFKNASGNVIIIQNPECLHVGDIIKYVDYNLSDDNYLSFSAYSLNQQKSNLLNNITLKSGNIMKTIKPIVMEPYKVEGDNGWYNHSIVRPKGYHFCSAITKENLINNLNGFDVRIKRLGLKIEIIDSPMVLHQWHTTGNSFRHTPSFWEKFAKNQKLFNEVTNNEKTYKVNIK